MPADPTANLGSQRLETLPDYIGHVASDFQERKHFNSLVVRPQYRISLRLGDLEELFPNSPSSPAGRMERMQVVGLFYYPLKHSKATNGFNGMPPKPAVAATATTPALPALPAVRGLWVYFKTRILDAADDAAADAEIQRLLREWVVDGGALPPPTEEGATPAASNFVKIRLPGAFSLMRSWRSPALNLNDDSSAPYQGWTLGKNLYDVETQYRKDNAVLGKIPLIAKVEKFDSASADWKPAVDVDVYFQLQDPYSLPAFDSSRPVAAQLNRPPLRDSTLGPPVVAGGSGAAGPARFAQPEENPTGSRQPNATDPQRGNCPKDRGGLQGTGNVGDGSDVANVVFSTTSLPGFNGPHVPPPAGGTVNPITRTNFFPVAQRVNDASHLHAVKAKTNADGEAGVLFTPSRCGGDRYRIRAYLGPPKFAGAGSNGQGAGAVAVDTGTLVVWRHMRISRYVRQPSSNVDATLLADATANAVALNIGNIVLPAVATANDYLQRVYAADGTGTVKTPTTADFSFTVPSVATGFDPLPVQWARAFVEVEIDRAAQGALPETMSNDDWERARAQAFRDGQSQLGSLGLNLDLERLFYMGASKPAGLSVANAVVHLPMRSRQSYNGPAGSPAVPANRRIGAGGNTVANIQNLIANYMIPGFIRSLSSNGYTPGLTIVQAVYGCTWTMFHNNAQGNYSDSSGESFDYRAGALWGGAAAYPTTPIVPAPSPTVLPWANYGFTSNVCHEVGHTNFCLHSNPPEPSNAIRHDPGASNLSVCVMSYQNCEGQFCAKCLFALRGWDLSKLTY